MKYCPDCGTVLELREIEQRRRAFCPECESVHYAQLKVGAGARIERNAGLLLLKRTREPFKGCWNLPAGYAECDESPRETVVREVHEETGLHVTVEGLVNVYFFDDDPRGNGILIVYTCHTVGGELRPSQEGGNPTFFLPGDMPADLAGGGHDQAVRAWNERVDETSNETHPDHAE